MARPYVDFTRLLPKEPRGRALICRNLARSSWSCTRRSPESDHARRMFRVRRMAALGRRCGPFTSAGMTEFGVSRALPRVPAKVR